MDPTNPAVPACPAQTVEEEVVAGALLKLMEAAGSEVLASTVEVTPSDLEKVALETILMLKARKDSIDEYLEDSDKQRLNGGGADEVLEVENDPPVLPQVRRCNRSSGQGWFCLEPAYPGYAVCEKHIKMRRDREKKMQAKKLRASTESEASAGTRREGQATSVPGEMVELSSPKPLA